VWPVLRVNHHLMSDTNSFPKNMLESLQKRVAESISGALWLLCAGLVKKYGDEIVHSAKNALGIQFLLQLGTLLLISCGYFCWKYFQIRKHLKKEPEPEKVAIVSGVEFVKGRRTLGRWLPFCPHCHTPLHPQDDIFPMACPSRCGWGSSIPQKEILKIMYPNVKED
jgi:hypothetical protein